MPKIEGVQKERSGMAHSVYICHVKTLSKNPMGNNDRRKTT
jgi:hypothetical protein